MTIFSARSKHHYEVEKKKKKKGPRYIEGAQALTAKSSINSGQLRINVLPILLR